jgi:hypothetical protein
MVREERKDLPVEHIAPKDEYLTQFQDRQAARQKTLANWLRLKGDEPPLPMIPRLCGMCSRLLFLTFIIGLASTARAWTYASPARVRSVASNSSTALRGNPSGQNCCEDQGLAIVGGPFKSVWRG